MGGVLAGRVVLVTGAARGLGASAARALAAAGARCVLLDLLEGRLSELGREVETLSRSPARVLAGDLEDRAYCRRAAAFAEDAAGGDLAAFVHCAGILERETVETTRDAAWDRTLAVNLSAAFFFLRALLPALRAGGGGSVVLTSSRAGVEGFAAEAAYCASKFGIEGLARAAAADCAGSGVVSNTITPGARIKPTGLSLREEARLAPEDRRWGSSDPLGPAFTALAALAGTPEGAPTGQRFRADRVAAAVERLGVPLPPEAWSDLAE